MNIKKTFITLAVLVSSVFSLTAQTSLKIATIAPSRSVWDIEAKKLSQDWAEITNGKVKMQFMNATAMGGETGVVAKLNAVRPGQKAPIDGAIFTNIGISALAPDTNIFTTCAPFLFRNQEEIEYVFDKFQPQMASALSEKGYVLIGQFMIGWAYFYTKKPVHTLDDLKSQKLYTSGFGMATMSDTFKAAGFKTEDIPDNKLLQSLKSPGGVEGFYSIPMYAYAGQYYKSLPYILNVPLCPIIATFIINEKTWNSFSAAEQKAMLKSIEEAEKVFLEEQKNADKEYIDLCVKGGCELITLSDAENKAMEEALRKDMSAMSKTGMMNKKFYDDIQAALKEYRGE